MNSMFFGKTAFLWNSYFLNYTRSLKPKKTDIAKTGVHMLYAVSCEIKKRGEILSCAHTTWRKKVD